MNYTDIISSIGVSLILLAFFLSTFKYILPDSKVFFILNLFGGIFACYGSYLLHSVPFVVLEFIWTIVAIVGLIKNLKN
jgi:hypothetical protein